MGADDSDASVSVRPGDPGDATAQEAGERDEGLEEAGPDANAADAAPSRSEDAMSADAPAEASGPPMTFDPSVCFPDAGPPDPSDADADAGPCSPTPAATLPQVLSGEVAQVTMQCGVDGGPPPLLEAVAASTVIQLSIGLPLRNGQQIAYCDDLISEPTSPFFRHYLTEDQFDALYEPTECDYQALIDWVQARGLTVDGTYSDRLLVGVSASAATIDAVFHVTLHYSTRPDGSQFYTPDRDPSFDLNVLVSGILGFDDCQVPMAI
jgi:hypothetical protein